MISDYVEECAAREELAVAARELEDAARRYAAARARLDQYLTIPVNLPQDTKDATP